jgi:hypothetical protein
MSFAEVVEQREKEELAAAKVLVRDHAYFPDLKWPDQNRALQLLNRVSSRQEGRTMAIADAKRRPYDDVMFKLQKIHDQQIQDWIHEASFGPEAECAEAPSA